MIRHTGPLNRVGVSLFRGQYVKYPKGVDTSVAVIIVIILTVTPHRAQPSSSAPRVGSRNRFQRAALCRSGRLCSDGERVPFAELRKGSLDKI